MAILLGGLTFVTATVGINIVANFISPAFDFSHVNPQKISWRTGGMIAAVGSVILTPWNWYNNSEAIQYSLGILGTILLGMVGSFIGGFLGYLLHHDRADGMLQTSGIIGSVVGAIIALLIYRRIGGRNRARA